MCEEPQPPEENESDLQTRLDAVYGAQSAAELEAAYDAWAKSYDVDLVEKLHWNAPERTAACLAAHAHLGVCVLDAGCGTGLVGEKLAALGFSVIDGLDLSARMIRVAGDKGVYRAFHQMALGPAMDLETDSYDAVIAVGVFTQGHAGPDCLEELVRITRSGGHIAFSLRPDVWEDFGFRAEQDRLVAAGRWRLVEETGFQEGFSSVQTRPYKIWVYTVA
jgi:predicted TPR repeat methyltransferase